jgi:hypothetical protein
MASGIRLGRIIDWAKNADVEELKYAVHRLGNIAQARLAQVEQADAHGKVKRTRRTKAQVHEPDMSKATLENQATAHA